MERYIEREVGRENNKEIFRREGGRKGGWKQRDTKMKRQ